MDNSINLRNEREKSERMTQWGAALVYIQKGGFTNIPKHAGLKKITFLSTGLLSEVEGKSIGLARKAIQFFPNELFGQLNAFFNIYLKITLQFL